MNIEEFGKTIKQKYPQYNDLSDNDLGEKMLAKYPQYQDMVTIKQPQGEQKPSLLKSAAKTGLGITSPSPLITKPISFMAKDILKGVPEEEKPKGVKGFLANVFQGTLGSKGLAGIFQHAGRVPVEEKELEKLSQSNLELTEKASGLSPRGKQKIMPLLEQARTEELGRTEEMVSPKEAAGTVLRGGAALAGLGTPSPTSLPLSLGKKIGYGALRSFLLTGEAVTGAGLQQEKEVSQAIKDAIPASLLSGVISTGSVLLNEGINKLTEKGPDYFYNKAIKQSSDEVKKELYGHAPKLATQLKEAGVKGSDAKIFSESLVGLSDTEKHVQEIIAKEGAEKTISTSNVANSLDELIRKYKNVFGEEGAKAIIDYKNEAILSKGDTLTLGQIFNLKRDIYSVLSDRSFSVDATLGQKSEALRTVASALREKIGETSPELAELTGQQQMWERTVQAVGGEIYRTGRHNLISLSDSVLGGLSVTAKSAAGLASTIGRKLVETTAFKTYAGYSLEELGKTINKLPTDAFGRITKTAVTGILSEFFGK